MGGILHHYFVPRRDLDFKIYQGRDQVITKHPTSWLYVLNIEYFWGPLISYLPPQHRAHSRMAPFRMLSHSSSAQIFWSSQLIVFTVFQTQPGTGRQGGGGRSNVEFFPTFFNVSFLSSVPHSCTLISHLESLVLVKLFSTVDSYLNECFWGWTGAGNFYTTILLLFLIIPSHVILFFSPKLVSSWETSWKKSLTFRISLGFLVPQCQLHCSFLLWIRSSSF